MRKFQTIEELVAHIEEERLVLLFIKTENCGVCDVRESKSLTRTISGYKKIVI